MCFRIWTVRSVERGYPLPQTEQKFVILPEWRRIWTAKLLRELQAFPHSVHKNCFLLALDGSDGKIGFPCESRCVRMWTFKWFTCFISLPEIPNIIIRFSTFSYYEEHIFGFYNERTTNLALVYHLRLIFLMNHFMSFQIFVTSKIFIANTAEILWSVSIDIFFIRLAVIASCFGFSFISLMLGHMISQQIVVAESLTAFQTKVQSKMSK